MKITTYVLAVTLALIVAACLIGIKTKQECQDYEVLHGATVYWSWTAGCMVDMGRYWASLRQAENTNAGR